MPSTHTVDPLTRDDLKVLKIDLRREMKQQFRAEMETVLHSYDHKQQFRAEMEDVLMKLDVRRELRKDLRTEMESVFREQANRRSDLRFQVYMSVMGAFYVATITLVIVRAALGA